MKKLITILFTIFPILSLADNSSLSFTPPPGDYSVVFLGNLFGVVDGVLHGTGSQIMGAIFSVFNAAVLALGGIIIMYTLIVSTMNTAHEGQMLGQKWSSIWVPVRAVMGLTLLIPKASGYCLMQIFVMWIVVQGVGAADKVWNAALSYLNRGGVIVQGQMDPSKDLLEGPVGSNRGLATGAYRILAGQVCMLGLQSQLSATLDILKKEKEKSTGICSPSNPGYGATIEKFCTSTVPNFISSVNFIDIQNNADSGLTFYKAPMPNFEDEPFKMLNGICGTITWNKFTIDASKMNTLTKSDLDTATMSRAIALQQMYLDLSAVAQVMINNNPLIKKPNSNNNKQDNNYTAVAQQQFGIPQNAMGVACVSNSPECVNWGPVSGSNSAVLFSGTEFIGAILDYNGIMMPSLTLIQQSNNSQSAGNEREFIKDANSKGWIMAGSYFYKLIQLNQSATNFSYDAGNKNNNLLVDKDIGFEKADSIPGAKVGEIYDNLSNPFSSDNISCNANSNYGFLCQWLDSIKTTTIVPILGLIGGYSGSGFSDMPDKASTIDVDFKTNNPHTDKLVSSTVLGFATNSMLLKLPGQPGQGGVKFANKIDFQVTYNINHLDPIDFDCGEIRFFILFKVCYGRMMGNIMYNYILRPLINTFLDMIKPSIDFFLSMLITNPLHAIAIIFKQGVHLISKPGINPIIALANMGTYYINYAMSFFVTLTGLTITVGLVLSMVGGGAVVLALIAVLSPLFIAMIGIMLEIGFVTAYYVPLVPYIIFTFGSIAWLMAVIEAMVAAPIVALGVTHPEGEGALGKGEQAIMILMNVFLRPSLMIIGYIAAISLTFVSVWIINAGFDEAISIIQNKSPIDPPSLLDPEYAKKSAENFVSDISKFFQKISGNWKELDDYYNGKDLDHEPETGYVSWAGTFGYFFAVVTYSMMYLIAVQKSFGLIAALPDKVLRWIGGQQENIGQESAGWGEEVKGKIEKGGDKMAAAAVQSQKAAAAAGKEGADYLLGKNKGSTGSVSGKSK